MTGLNWKSELLSVVIHRSLKGTGNASNGTGGAKFFSIKQILDALKNLRASVAPRGVS
jgi:hypothetical protein